MKGRMTDGYSRGRDRERGPGRGELGGPAARCARLTGLRAQTAGLPRMAAEGATSVCGGETDQNRCTGPGASWCALQISAERAQLRKTRKCCCRSVILSHQLQSESVTPLRLGRRD